MMKSRQTTRPVRDEPLDSDRLLLVSKPKGWTSFDVVARLRRIFGIRKIGHAGTLDPMATGLLIICTGQRTKEIDRFMDLEKEYRATMRLGGVTPSYDAETPVTAVNSIEGISETEIRAAMQEFTGIITQLPPMHSAVKVRGRRLYRYARKGKEVERPSREVEVRSMEVESVSLPDVTFVVRCSKGTYVRALAHDIGQHLGCGAYLTALERTRIGPYRLEDASTPDEIAKMVKMSV
jgi:tRNA pseudouridine55 synthase